MDELDMLDIGNGIGGNGEFESDNESGDDEIRHKKLLKSLGVSEKPETTEKSYKDQRSEATNECSIFSIGLNKRSSFKVKPHHLVEGLKESANVNLLKKNLSRVEKSKQQLRAPLARATAERTERDAAYQSTTEKVSRWDDIVKRNRRAEQLTFPLKQDNLQIHTVDEYVKRFKPKTPLEQQIYAVLKGNKYAERPDNDLSIAEEQALKSMSLEDARQRRAELQKHRALLSYHEAKNRRLGKIKSRRHLRIIRKQKEKKSAAAFDELQKKDPEGAAAKLKQAEKLRAEERAVLRHRQGSKWAKGRLLMAKHDEVTKVQLQEQKKLHGQLTQKNLVQIESSDENDDDTDANNNDVVSQTMALVPPTASLQTLHLPRDNPWLRQGGEKKKEEKEESQSNIGGKESKEEHAVTRRTRSQTGILGLDAVSQQEDAEDALDEEESSDEEELKQELTELKRRKKFRLDMEEPEPETEENDGIQLKSIENFKSAFANLQKEEKKARKKGKIQEDNRKEDDVSNVDEEEEDAGLNVSTSWHRTLNDLEKVLETEDDLETLSELRRDPRVEKPESKKELEYIDPTKVFTLPTKTVKSMTPKTIEDEDANTSDEEDRNLMTIQEAFADDNVLADFVAEKKSKIAESKPKDVDLTLPGWGEWGGVGMKPSKRKKKFFIKPQPRIHRRDHHLGPVIINENRDVHIAKHQVNKVPFPFTSDEQFERAFRQPIGQTWNTPLTFKKLTEPKVKTAVGAIIQPMDEDDAFDQMKPRKRKVHFKKADEEIPRDGARQFKRKKGNKKHKK